MKNAAKKTTHNLQNLIQLAEIGEKWVQALKEEQGKKRDEGFIKSEERRLKLIRQTISDIESKFKGKPNRTFSIEYAATLADYMKDKCQVATIEATSLQSAQKIIRKQMGKIYLRNMPYQKPNKTS